MSLEQALISAIVALAGCVGTLFAWFKSQFRLVVKKLDDCESDRAALWKKIAEMAAGSFKPKTHP